MCFGATIIVDQLRGCGYGLDRLDSWPVKLLEVGRINYEDRQPGRRATISISTSTSRAKAVTPMQVRAGKRSAGKYDA